MSNIISFSKARKKITRQEKEKHASENRVKFGRKKVEKKLEDAQKTKRDKHLSDHKLDD
jgi:Domain of unknown function (DUF4169)|tara:strand:+ start:322644 stop:322820 length:177 start_codon:yes stop_codon:yes gene_type:complete